MIPTNQSRHARGRPYGRVVGSTPSRPGVVDASMNSPVGAGPPDSTWVRRLRGRCRRRTDPAMDGCDRLVLRGSHGLRAEALSGGSCASLTGRQRPATRFLACLAVQLSAFRRPSSMVPLAAGRHLGRPSCSGHCCPVAASRGSRRSSSAAASVLSVAVTAAVAVGGLALEPLARHLVLGQVNLVLAASCRPRPLRRPRAVLEGSLRWAVAAGVKLTPAVFVVFFLLKRDWAAAARSFATFVATVALGWLVAPASSARYWLEDFDKTARFGADALMSANQSLRALVVRATGVETTRPWRGGPRWP